MKTRHSGMAGLHTAARALAVAVATAAVAAGPAVAQPCEAHWSDQFASGEFHGLRPSLAGFDDGTGPALYIGFTYVFQQSPLRHGLVRMTDRGWAELAGGGFPSGGVTTLMPFDDGSGEVLAVAGGLVPGYLEPPGVAFWDGDTWSVPAGGLGGDFVWPVTLAVFDDDGTGPALFVGGVFTEAGGTPVSSIAKWDGHAWSDVGGGVTGVGHPIVYAMAVYDDGSGPALYAAGRFSVAGGVLALNIARWDGLSWSQVGGGIDGLPNAMTVFDDGTGPALYVGGDFLEAGGAVVNHIAKWDGAAWWPLGTGLNDEAEALAVFDDGGGPALYVAGDFTEAGGIPVYYVARWDGASWSAVGEEVAWGLSALAVFDDGSGPALYGANNYFVYRWDGSAWRRHHGGVGDSLHGSVEVSALATAGDTAAVEPGVYVGGKFWMAGSVDTTNIARFDGQRWHALGDGLECAVYALELYDDGPGDGAVLFAGTSTYDCSPNGVLRWDGASWMDTGGPTGVDAMTVFDDGTGPALYAAGYLEGFDLSRWNGVAWAPVADVDGSIRDLIVFDDGGGPALYMAGHIDSVEGVEVSGLARFDGSAWSDVGGGVDLGGQYASHLGIYALAVYDDGGGPALFAGGLFHAAGGVPVNYIARWDGDVWTSVGDGLAGLGWVRALTVVEEADGTEALYAGGTFAVAGGTSASRIARWNGSFWSPLDAGVNDTVRALASFGTGRGEDLFAGGEFTAAGDLSSNYIARWSPCPDGNPPPYPPCRYDVTFINAPDGSYAPARAMNGRGDVVGTFDGGGYLWISEEGFTPLGFTPVALNDEGDIVGYGDGDVVLYRDGQLTVLPVPPGTNYRYINAINNDAAVVGYATGSYGRWPLLWEDGSAEVLDMPEGSGEAWDINDQGVIVGECSVGGETRGFVRQSDGSLTVMPPIPGGFRTEPRAVNQAGVVAGSGRIPDPDDPDSTSGVRRGFVWQDGQFTLLDPLPEHEHSAAWDVNDDGVAVGYSVCTDYQVDCPPYDTAVAWRGGVPTTLNEVVPWDLDLFIAYAWEINDAGQMVGRSHSWRGRGTVLLNPVELVGDIDGDCHVDDVDFLILLFEWGKTDSPADLNGDGIVDVRDFLLLLANWR